MGTAGTHGASSPLLHEPLPSPARHGQAPRVGTGSCPLHHHHHQIHSNTQPWQCGARAVSRQRCQRAGHECLAAAQVHRETSGKLICFSETQHYCKPGTTHLPGPASPRQPAGALALPAGPGPPAIRLRVPRHLPSLWAFTTLSLPKTRGGLRSQISHLAAAPISCNKKLLLTFFNALPKRARRDGASGAACHLDRPG